MTRAPHLSRHCKARVFHRVNAGRPTPHTQHKIPTTQRSSHDPLTLHPAPQVVFLLMQLGILGPLSIQLKGCMLFL